MTEREEALRRFPPAEAKKLIPMTQIDLRNDYDAMARVKGGRLYRKGGVIQVWWDYYGPETWTSDEANAKKNFIAMKERWGDRSEMPGRIPQVDIEAYKQRAYTILESPEFWFDLHRVKDLAGLTYWAEVYKLMDVLMDKEFLAKARKFYESFKYPTEASKTALKNIKDIEESQCRLPQTILASPARQIKDRLEKLWKNDPDKFYKELKGITDAIKERGRGKIKKLPDISLTELRDIKKEADALYR